MKQLGHFLITLCAGLLLAIPKGNAQCTANAGSDVSACAGSSIALGGAPSASGGTAPYQYTWTGSPSIASVANPMVALSSTTTITLTITDANGCTATDQVVVTITPQPTANGGPDRDPCLNDPNLVLPSGGIWSGATQVTPAGVFTPNTVGTYNLTYTVTSAGCTNTDLVVVIVRPRPVVTAIADLNICPGGTAQLGASATSPNGAITLYTWSGGPVSNSLSQNPTATPTATTTYSVTAVDVEGCNNNDQITVFVQNVLANAGPDLTLCNSPTPTTLTGQSPAGGIWSGAGVTPSGSFTPPGLGTYTLTYTVTNGWGCTATDTRLITVTGVQTVNSGSDYQVCLNSPALQLQPITSGGTWSGSPSVTAAGLFSPSTAGVFTLTYTITSGSCSGSDQSTVTVYDRPVVDAGAPVSTCAGVGASLNSTVTGGTAPYSYQWSPAATLSNASIPNPVATPTVGGPYILTVTDVHGCSGSDNVFITVQNGPTVYAGPDITLCNQPVVAQMGNQSPAGGTWSGPGILPNGNFTPPGEGNYTVTYSVTGSNGCVGSDTRLITVVPAGNVNAGPDVTLCQNGPAYQLEPITPGGFWSGSPHVSFAGLFTPLTAGSFNLSYTINGGTCTITDQIVVTVVAPPVVNVTDNIASCTGSSFAVTASATGGSGVYVQYEWMDQNGQVLANGATFTATSTTNATYIVEVTDNAGCKGIADVAYSAWPLPVVNAGSDATMCVSSVPVTMSGQSPAGGTWSGAGITPGGSFIPGTPGTYTVQYCYTNPNGCSACDTKSIQVVNPQPIFAGPDRSVCMNGQVLNLAAQASVTGTWSGAGISNAASGVFQPAMAGAGNHTITLSFGSGACATTDQLNIEVVGLPAVSAGPDQVVCYNSGALLLTSGTPSGGVWRGVGFDDDDDDDDLGVFATDQNPGDYTVEYIFIDPTTQCGDTAACAITIAPLPQAAFSVASVLCEDADIDLNNSSSGVVSYLWNFNGEFTSTSPNPDVTFNSEGLKNIELQVTNSFGCSDATSAITDVIEAPQALFEPSATIGCSPLTINFNNQSSGHAATFTWDLAGTTSTTPGDVSRTFVATATAASFTVLLTVQNACGTSTYSESITVNPQPDAAFSYNILGTMCSPIEVAFMNTSVGDPGTVNWDFDDGTGSFLSNPGNRYFYNTGNQNETYEVRLSVSNGCGVDEEVQTIIVQPNHVHAAFAVNATADCAPFDCVIHNTGTGALQYTYTEGSTTFATTPNANYTFNDPGTYIVYQIATDGCGFDTTHKVITVLESPVVAFTTDVPQACTNGLVHFNGSGNAENYTWNFDDGVITSGNSQVHVYANPGNYQVAFTGTSGNGCSTTVVQSFPVHPTPIAAFDFDVTGECTPMLSCMNNTSTDADTYQWQFGLEEGESTEDQPCNTFINNTNDLVYKTITLTASNQWQCASTSIRQIAIKPRPSGYFEMDAYQSCEHPITIQTHIVDPLSQYFNWFIDGTITSSQQQPALTFEAIGEYTVKFVSENVYGCADSSERVFEVFPPVAAAFDSDVQSGCVDFDVQFFSESQNAEFLQWNFDDGTVVSEYAPDHTFTEPGLYDIELIATSPDGCRDTLVRHNMIEVHGLPSADFSFTPEKTSIYFPDVQFFNESPEAVAVRWRFGTGATSEAMNPVYTFPHAGEWPVTLTVTNIYGCESSLTQTVVVDNEFYVFVPNAFSPDGDGLNETFGPVFEGEEFIERYDFYVFNRWGIQMFHTEDPRMHWTGNTGNGGHYVQNDAYTYRIIMKFKDNPTEKVLEGSITIVR
jgi:large repetitive protein